MSKVIDFQKAVPERKFNGKRIEIARVFRGIAGNELAEKIGVNRQTISMYENNKLNNPEFATIQKIANELHFPIRFFLENDLVDFVESPTYFRSLLTTGKRYRREQESKLLVVKIIYEYLGEYLKFKPANLPNISSNDDIEDAALRLRECWGLGLKPIDNLVYIAESNGLVVSDFESTTGDVDAYSHKIETEKSNTFLIGYSRNKNTAARVHFDLAHELGHILLHNWNEDIENIEKEEFKQIEQEAHNFASSFLLPKEAFIADIGNYADKLAYYVEMKKRWKVSIAAMIRRSYNLKLINSDDYQRLMRSMQKQGIRKVEPLDDKLVTAKPSLLREAIHLLFEKGVITAKEFLNELSFEYGLTMYPDDLESLLGLPKGTLKTEVVSPKVNLELKSQF